MITNISTKPWINHLQSKMLHKTIQENLRKIAIMVAKCTNVERGVKSDKMLIFSTK